MNKFNTDKSAGMARLDFWAPESMRDWVDRQATREGLHRSEYMRRLILGEMGKGRETGENSPQPPS